MLMEWKNWVEWGFLSYFSFACMNYAPEMTVFDVWLYEIVNQFRVVNICCFIKSTTNNQKRTYLFLLVKTLCMCEQCGYRFPANTKSSEITKGWLRDFTLLSFLGHTSCSTCEQISNAQNWIISLISQLLNIKLEPVVLNSVSLRLLWYTPP